MQIASFPLVGPAQALLSVCVAVAAMEALTRDDGASFAFRSVCALSVACGAISLLSALLGA